MSNSVQDPNATANQAADTPISGTEQIEKGKGKMTEEAMDDDDDDDESGEVSLATTNTACARYSHEAAR